MNAGVPKVETDFPVDAATVQIARQCHAYNSYVRLADRNRRAVLLHVKWALDYPWNRDLYWHYRKVAIDDAIKLGLLHGKHAMAIDDAIKLGLLHGKHASTF